MLYMAKSWHVQAPDLDAKLDKAVSDFETILKELEARGTPNEEIANAQRRARAHWGFTLKGIDLHVDKGERIGVIGMNGKGKSTLLKLMAGEIKPRAGTIKLHDATSVGFAAAISAKASA